MYPLSWIDTIDSSPNVMFPMSFSSSSLNFIWSSVMWLFSSLSRYHMLISTRSSPFVTRSFITFPSLSIRLDIFSVGTNVDSLVMRECEFYLFITLLLSTLDRILSIFFIRLILDPTLVLSRVGIVINLWGIVTTSFATTFMAAPRSLLSLLWSPCPFIPEKEESTESFLIIYASHSSCVSKRCHISFLAQRKALK